MAERVKTRPYNSPRRREQAAATRRQILDAAQRLFERQGYAATTMAAIAAEAGVALKTVYLAFETKSGVLRALWNLLLRGDEGEAPVAERSWYREVIAEQGPGAPAAAERPQLTSGEDPDRGCAEGDPQRRSCRSRHRCPVGIGSRPSSMPTSA